MKDSRSGKSTRRRTRVRWIFALVPSLAVVALVTVAVVRGAHRTTVELLPRSESSSATRLHQAFADLHELAAERRREGRVGAAEALDREESLLHGQLDDPGLIPQPSGPAELHVVCAGLVPSLRVDQIYDLATRAVLHVRVTRRGRPVTLLLSESLFPVRWKIEADDGVVLDAILLAHRLGEPDSFENLQIPQGAPRPRAIRARWPKLPPPCDTFAPMGMDVTNSGPEDIGGSPLTTQIAYSGDGTVIVGPESGAWREQYLLATAEQWSDVRNAERKRALALELGAVRFQAVLSSGEHRRLLADASGLGLVGGAPARFSPTADLLAVGPTAVGPPVVTLRTLPDDVTAVTLHAPTGQRFGLQEGTLVRLDRALDRAVPLRTRWGFKGVALTLDTQRDRLVLLDDQGTLLAQPLSFDAADGSITVGEPFELARVTDRTNMFHPSSLAYSAARDEVIVIGRQTLRSFSAFTGLFTSEMPLPRDLRTRGDADVLQEQAMVVGKDELFLLFTTRSRPRRYRPEWSRALEGVLPPRDAAPARAERSWWERVGQRLPGWPGADAEADQDREPRTHLYGLDMRSGTVVVSGLIPPPWGIVSIPVFLAVSGSIVGGGLFVAVSVVAVRRGRQARQRALEVTERTRQLETANATLADANLALDARARDVELYTKAVSHGVRSPISAAAEALRLLSAITPTPGSRLSEMAQANIRRADRMLAGLGQLMAQAAQTEPNETLSIEAIVREVLEELASMPGTEGVEMVLKSPLPDVVGQRTKVQLVFHNLLVNAFKHTVGHSGARIEVGGELVSGDVTFWVRDNGDGVPTESQRSIFEPFQRASNSRGDGMGLGLALVKQVVEQHGGEIWVESIPGAGATFWLTLPLPKSVQP